MKRTWPRGALFLLMLAGLAHAVESNTLVFVQEGTLPIVLSAPHGGTNAVDGVVPRKGETAKQFVSGRDGGTFELAQQIAAGLEKELGGKPYLVMAQFDRQYIDANRPAADAYEQDAAAPTYSAYHRALSNAVASIRSRWGRGLLIDVHGQGAQADAIFRGTKHGLTATALTKRCGEDALIGPASLFGQFAARGYAVIPPVASTNREDARYNGGFTVRTYGSHLPGGIDAIQAEFGANFRSRKNRPAVATNVAAAMAAFARNYLPTAEPAPEPSK